MILDENIKTFMVHMISFSLSLKIMIHPTWKAQIALLLTIKVIVLAEYINFTNIFFNKCAKIFLEWTSINKHTIELKNDKQLSYKPIYSLKLFEHNTLKTYMKTNLANGFIWLLKSSAGIFILFI